MAKFTITHKDGHIIYSADYAEVVDIRNGRLVVDGKDFTELVNTRVYRFNIKNVKSLFADDDFYSLSSIGTIDQTINC